MRYVIIAAIVVIIAVPLIKLVIKLIVAIFRFVKKHIRKIISIIAILTFMGVFICYPTTRIPILTFAIIYLFILFLREITASHKRKKSIRNWLIRAIPVLTEAEADDVVLAIIEDIESADLNLTEYKFNYSSIPLGKANAFLNYSNTSIEDEEVLYFLPVFCDDSNEMCEYGLVITRTIWDR